MRKGLTEKIDAIIEKVAELECIKPGGSRECNA